MADQENIPVAPVMTDEDTRTRKTVRLRTIVPAATGPSLQDVPAAPAPADDDTRTRSTVKLSPTAKAPAAPVIPPIETAAAPNEDTRTRLTVKLKPAAKVMPDIASAPAPAPVAPAPAPVAPAPAPVAPAPAPVAAVEEDDTRTRRNTVIASAGVSVDDDRTVKIQRPTLNRPAPAPAPAASAAEIPEAPTVNLKKPVLTPNMNRPVPPAGMPGAVPPAGRPGAVPPAGMPGAVPPAGMPGAVPPVVPGAAVMNEQPSKFYMIMSVITLIFMLAVAAMTTAHYLTYEHNVEVELPGLPAAGK